MYYTCIKLKGQVRTMTVSAYCTSSHADAVLLKTGTSRQRTLSQGGGVNVRSIIRRLTATIFYFILTSETLGLIFEIK
jgi:hypothetical protein